MFNSFVNPIAMEALGWKYYLVYVAFLVVISVVIYLFYAETKDHSLEEIADIFEGPAVVAGIARRRNERARVLETAGLGKELAVTEVEDVGRV